jgi:hypothetical protein
MTLTEFLLARIAEDEYVARAFVNELGEAQRWQADEVGGTVRRIGTPPFGLSNVEARTPTHLTADHIARHDPARVLAECEAKRRIVERDGKYLIEQWRRYSDEHHKTFDEWFTKPYGTTLRDLASVYADHPDYDEAWRD